MPWVGKMFYMCKVTVTDKVYDIEIVKLLSRLFIDTDDFLLVASKQKITNS